MGVRGGEEGGRDWQAQAQAQGGDKTGLQLRRVSAQSVVGGGKGSSRLSLSELAKCV